MLTGSSARSPTFSSKRSPAPRTIGTVGADALDNLLDDFRVGGVLAALQAMLFTPAGGRKCPFVQAHPALAERIVEAWPRPGDEAVERDRDVASD